MSEPREQPAPDREKTGVNVRATLILGASLLLVVVAASVLMVWLFGYFSREAAHTARAFPLAADSQRQLPPEPRLQTTPRQDLRALRAREDAVLLTYGWVDKGSGIARIPIDEAMKITAQRGLPAREAK